MGFLPALSLLSRTENLPKPEMRTLWSCSNPSFTSSKMELTSAVDFSIADPDGDETIAFSGHVKSVKRVSPPEDAFEADVVIQPTGAPTIT